MNIDLTDPIYNNEEAARKHFEASRWPDGPVCPHCGVIGEATELKGKSTRPGLYNCRACDKPFTATIGTIFERSHIPMHKWLLAVRLMASSKKGISAHQLYRMLGFGSYRTAWFMAHRIRESMRSHRFQSSLTFPGREDTTVTLHSGDPHSRRLRIVCRDCNHGWMSDLQQEAKPFLVPLLTGHSASLHRRAQKILSAWIAMTVMVAEFAARDRMALPASDRKWLFETKTVPPHWRIWIGRHRRQNYALYTKRILTLVPPEEIQRAPRDAIPPGNTQTTTICLGEHLIVHVMSSVVARSIVRRWKLPPLIAPSMGQIWPSRVSVVRWPMQDALILSDTEIDLLADHFFSRATALSERLERARGTLP